MLKFRSKWGAAFTHDIPVQTYVLLRKDDLKKTKRGTLTLVIVIIVHCARCINLKIDWLESTSDCIANVTFSQNLKGKGQDFPLSARHFWPLSSCHLRLHSSLMLLPPVSAALRTWNVSKLREETMMHLKSICISTNATVIKRYMYLSMTFTGNLMFLLQEKLNHYQSFSPSNSNLMILII